MSNGPGVVVVGAGVIGASIAYRLARAGARVTLVDRGAPGQGTSANSFAWVNSNDKPPLAYHRLNAESVVAHRRLRDDVAADLAKTSEPPTGEWLHDGGGLEWTDTEAGRQRLLEKAARLREWSYRVEVVTEAEVHALEPHLRLDGMTAATFCPDEAWVDGPRFAADLGAAAAALGATVRTGEAVVGLERNGEQVTAVRLAGGERLAAGWVVIAAGRWTDRVATLAGVQVPLAPTCGLLAVTSPVSEGVGRVVHVPGMNFRPDPSGGLVLQSGATDAIVTAETPPDPALPGCADLLQRVRRVLPGAAGARIVAARVGVRPMPADGYSIVGPVHERPGLYLCVTHSGITLSALFGEVVAAEVTDGPPDPRLAGFRPSRCVRLRD
jgi:glycine/D-amino acid oxidase-like deaminating enzyme